MKPIIKFALGIAGMSEKTINDIEQALPAMSRLIAFALKYEAEVAALAPDLKAVLPVIDEIVNFTKGE